MSDSDSKEECFSYICVPKQGARPFLPQKAKAIKGLKPTSYKFLTSGENITLENGTVVTPDDVCGPSPPAQCVAFVFMPDHSYLAPFLT